MPGFLGHIWRAVRPILPLALAFMPGMQGVAAGLGAGLGASGTMASVLGNAVVGAGTGMIGGGGINGALRGAAGGAIGGGLAGGVEAGGITGAGGSGAFSNIGRALSIANSAGSLFSNNTSRPYVPNQNGANPQQSPLTRPDAMGRPAGIANMSGYTPEQERSALATKGLNQGLGTDENSYYKNLVSRSLIGDKNKITDNPNALLPVESQYFSQQGMNTSNYNNFLRALRGA